MVLALCQLQFCARTTAPELQPSFCYWHQQRLPWCPISLPEARLQNSNWLQRIDSQLLLGQERLRLTRQFPEPFLHVKQKYMSHSAARCTPSGPVGLVLGYNCVGKVPQLGSDLLFLPCVACALDPVAPELRSHLIA